MGAVTAHKEASLISVAGGVDLGSQGDPGYYKAKYAMSVLRLGMQVKDRVR